MDIDRKLLKNNNTYYNIIIMVYIIFRRVNYLRFDVIYVKINLSQHHTSQFHYFGIFSFFFLII